MIKNELENCSSKGLQLKHIKITYIGRVDNYLYIMLDNGQKILTDGKDLYDISEYNSLSDIFTIGTKLCAVLNKNLSLCVVDLKTNEILFEDKQAYHVSKNDERTLRIIKKIGCGNNTIYDIETQKYLPSYDNYEFEKSLGNNLYVFREQHNNDINFYDYKRCIISADGKIIASDITGWIDLCNNYIIITKNNELCIIRINNDLTLNIKTIKQDENIIAKPDYHNGNIIIMEKGVIKIFTPNLDLVNKFVISDLDKVIDYEIVSDILMICLPYVSEEKRVNKHLFVNLKTGKMISHVRIEGFPYWNPKVYIGKDSLKDDEVNSFEYNTEYEQTNYHIYDSNFNKVLDIKGNFYESIYSKNEQMFFIGRWEDNKVKRTFVNTETKVLKDSNYSYIYFSYSNQYGYAFNILTDMIDIVDENLNVVIPNIDYKKLKISNYDNRFNYFVVNNYACIIKHFVDGYGMSRYRTIVQKSDGKIILDSLEHKCYAVGNFIQIIQNGKSEFLDTITGKVGTLEITALTDDFGKMDLKNIKNINNILKISNNENHVLLIGENDQTGKVKKLI